MPVGNPRQDLGIFTVINANETDNVHGCQPLLVGLCCLLFAMFVVGWHPGPGSNKNANVVEKKKAKCWVVRRGKGEGGPGEEGPGEGG